MRFNLSDKMFLNPFTVKGFFVAFSFLLPSKSCT